MQILLNIYVVYEYIYRYLTPYRNNLLSLPVVYVYTKGDEF